MTGIILGITSSLISGLLVFVVQRYLKNKEIRDIERDSIKARENMLILKTINAVGKLTESNSIALRDGKTNGEMREAMDAYTEVNKELYDYLLERNACKN